MTAILPFNGQIISEPKLSRTKSGKDRVSLRISVNSRKNDDDTYESDLLWAVAYDDFARNIVDSFAPIWEGGGKSVRVTGTARYNQYEGSVTIDDEVIEGIEKAQFSILSIGPDLRFATATPEANERKESGSASKPRKVTKRAASDVEEDEAETESVTDESEEPTASSRPKSRSGSTRPKSSSRSKAKKKTTSDAIF